MTDRAEQMREAARREAIRLAHDGDHSVARAIAALPLPPVPPLADEWGYETCYPLKACVWWRESTQEWVLEIAGAINDTSFSCRHTQPANTKPEDVPGLPSLYANDAPLADDVVEVLEILRDSLLGANRETCNRAADLIERLAGTLADWQKSQTYRYIGRDGKPVLARELEARAEKAEAEVARLLEALEEIARQRLSIEMGKDEADAADWEGGYDMCVGVARAALTSKGADHG